MADPVHGLIVGVTRTGKTYLAQALARAYLRQGISVLVLDPNMDAGWPINEGGTAGASCRLYRDAMKFLAVCKASRRCVLMVDEGGETIGQGKLARDVVWLTTRSRHWGHRCILLSQEATLIYKPIRRQCSEAFIFRQADDNARELVGQFAEPRIMEATRLPPRVFLHVRSCEPPQLCRLEA